MSEENEKPSVEAALAELQSMRDHLLDGAARNQRVHDATEEALGRIAREFYPGMNTYWQGEQLRELQKEISFLATLYWQALSKLDHEAEKSLDKPAGK